MHQRMSHHRLHTPRLASRRSLLKAGAHAAWLTPTVVLVTNAPAAATCSGPPRVQVSTSVSSAGDQHTVTVTLNNTGSPKPPTSTVRITMNGQGTFNAGGTTMSAGTWTRSAITATTVDYTTSAPIACGSSTFTVKIMNSNSGQRTFSAALIA